MNRLRFYPAPVESPCIKICVYDPVRKVCTGCGRTLDEIAAWADLDECARARILADLPARLKSRANP